MTPCVAIAWRVHKPRAEACGQPATETVDGRPYCYEHWKQRQRMLKQREQVAREREAK